MNLNDLLIFIEIEISDIDLTVDYILQLYETIGTTKPDVFQKAAITQLVAQFYNGIENILKIMCKYKNHTIPYGSHSHIELFNLFIEKNPLGNPILFTNIICDDFIGIRKFRHFAIHGYAFKIKWEYIKPSLERLKNSYIIFKSQLFQFVELEK